MDNLKFRLLRTSFLGAVAALSFGTAGIAQAQTAIDEVVVTARRVEENVQNIPLAITALSGAALERMAVNDITGLSSISPNLVISDGSTGAGSTVIALRGQNQPSILITTDPAVGLYIDEVVVPLAYGTQASLVDIKRVEVLNGPQGTLYGKNTTGGAVSFFTNDPGPERSFELNGGVGNFRGWSLGGIANLPITENFGARIVAEHHQRNGYGKNLLNGQDLELDRRDLLRLKLKYEKGPLSAVFSGEYSYMNSGGRIPHITGVYNGGGTSAREIALAQGLGTTPAALAQAGNILSSYIVDKNSPNFYNTFGNVKSLSMVYARNYSFIVSYEVSDYFSVKSITGHHNVSATYANDNDGTPFFISSSSQPSKYNYWSEEIQLLGGNDRHNWVIGGFFSDQDGVATEAAIQNAVTSNFVIGGVEGYAKARGYSIFGQGNYKITDRLTATLGARYTTETKSLISLNRNSLGCTIGVAFRDDGVTCRRTSKDTFKSPTWLASLDYQISDDILVYVKASRGFKSGAFGLRTSGTIAATYAATRPEYVQEYELGVKSELLDRRLRLNLAAYYDRYTDIQRTVVILITTSPLAIGSVFVNAAKAHLTGFEAQADWRATPELTFNGTIGTLNPKYDSFVDFSGDRSAEPWPTPKLTYNIGATYAKDVEFGRVSATMNYVYQSKSAISGTNARFIDDVSLGSIGLLNGSATVYLADADLELSLWATNIANKRTWANSINLEAVGYNVRFAGAPRLFGMKFKKTF